MGILFSNAAMNAGNILYEEGAEGIEAYTDQVNQSGFAQQQAAKLTDNLKGDVEQLGGAFESAFIKIGSGANGPLRATVQTTTDLVNAFADLPDGVQQAIILAGLGAGAFAGLHKVMGPLAQSTSSVGRGLSLALDPMQRIQGLASGVQGAFEMMRLSAKNLPETQLSRDRHRRITHRTETRRPQKRRRRHHRPARRPMGNRHRRRRRRTHGILQEISRSTATSRKPADRTRNHRRR